MVVGHALKLWMLIKKQTGDYRLEHTWMENTIMGEYERNVFKTISIDLTWVKTKNQPFKSFSYNTVDLSFFVRYRYRYQTLASFFKDYEIFFYRF